MNKAPDSALVGTSTVIPPHEIHEFVRRSQQLIADEYQRVRETASEDPGTAGDQGEENWRQLLEQWLPPYFPIVTKGRILTADGYRSKQIDLMVLSPTYPRLLLQNKQYMAAGVLAAFECKLTLKASHVREAVKTGSELKKRMPIANATPRDELYAPILYGLLAHSHSWVSAKSKPVETIEKSLWQADAESISHPRECIDILTVADLSSWAVMKSVYFGPKYPLWKHEMADLYGPQGSATSSYVRFTRFGDDDDWATQQQTYFSPIGVLLSGLFSRLAWSFPEMRPLEEYFRKVNMLGRGAGKQRNWTANIYSEAIREKIVEGQFRGGGTFDEWNSHFFL